VVEALTTEIYVWHHIDGGDVVVDVSTDFTEYVFAIVDKRDAQGFAALFAPEGRFVFGNADPIVGPAGIAAAVTRSATAGRPAPTPSPS
jgi:hypothetical protein